MELNTGRQAQNQVLCVKDVIPQTQKKVFSFFAAFAIKCNVCYSSQSMRECISNEDLVDCDQLGAGFEVCLKTTFVYGGSDVEIKKFAKSCSYKSTCEEGNEAFKRCKRVSGKICKLDCCDTDGCNNGKALAVSVVVVAACALMAVFL